MIVLRTLSSLQRKGVALVALILLAESVTLSNAVKLWSNFQASYETLLDENGRRNNQGECPTTPTDAHTGRQARSPLRFLPSFKVGTPRSRPVDIAECCSKCSNCMEQARVLKCPTTTIPRGGHSAIHHAAETLAEGVAKEAGVTPYGIPLHLWKILFQAILTTINVACWLLPLRSKKITENKLGLSLANAFSGGVFLSLAFGHLIPECVHGFHDYQESVPYMLVLAGYLLIFFVEKVAFDAHDILHEMEHGGTGHSHSHGNDKAQVSENGTDHVPSAGRGAVILLGALAVHSVLEMMALGLADSFGESALLTLSIALHQPAESIALLVAFLKSGMPKPQIIQFLSVFSAMGPIGVALGIAVNEFAAPIVDSAMLAIVAGTFVYVGATEVIPEEWEESEHKWKKFAALMSGIVSIFVITQYTMTLGVQ